MNKPIFIAALGSWPKVDYSVCTNKNPLTKCCLAQEMISIYVFLFLVNVSAFQTRQVTRIFSRVLIGLTATGYHALYYAQ